MLGAIDQGLSSAQNFAMVVVVARHALPAELGRFTIVFTLLTAAVALSEATVSEPAMLRRAANLVDRSINRVVVTGCLILGVAVAICLAVVSLFTSAAIGHLVLVAALIAPGLLLQDGCRLAAIGESRPGLLLSLDGLWIALWAGCLVLFRPHGATAQLGAWGGPAMVAALLGTAALRARPVGPEKTVRTWWTTLRPSAASLVNEYVALTASSQAATLGVSGIATVGDAGILRAGQSLFGPVNVLTNALRIIVVPEVVRHGGSRSLEGRRILGMTAVFGMSVAAAVAAGFWALPGSAGRHLLGHSWKGAHATIIAVGTAKVAMGASGRALGGLRADNRFRTIVRIRNLASVTTIVGCLAGASVDGYLGAAWGLAMAGVVNFVVYEYHYARPLPDRFTPLETPPQTSVV